MRRIALAIALCALSGVTACSTSKPDDQSSPKLTVERRTQAMKHVDVSAVGRRVASVEELAALSDLVVRGRVLSTNRGAPQGDSTPRLVEIEIDKVYYSSDSAGAAPRQVSIITNGWTAKGLPMLTEHEPWFQAGDDIMAFLVKEASGFYSQNSIGSAFLLADGVVQGDTSTEAAQALVGKSIASADRVAEDAATRVQSGEFSLTAVESERKRAQIAEVAKRWTKEPETIAHGSQDGRDWQLNYAPVEGGFCWAVDVNNPAPTTCVSLDTVKSALALSKTGAVVIRQDDPAVLYGVADASIGEVKLEGSSVVNPSASTDGVAPVGDLVVNTSLAPGIPNAEVNGLPRYFIVDLGDRGTEGFEICTSRGCDLVGPAAS